MNLNSQGQAQELPKDLEVGRKVRLGEVHSEQLAKYPERNVCILLTQRGKMDVVASSRASKQNQFPQSEELPPINGM